MKRLTQCPHGMGLPAACIDCLADGPCEVSTGSTDVPYLGDAERLTVAKRDSNCPECHAEVQTGDQLGLLDGRWLCERCTA